MDEHTTNTQTKEALQYWGFLFQADKCGTDLLNRLLMGIANHITTCFEPADSPDITPHQLAAFYKAVGGDYDSLFTQTSPSSIAFIYRSLGCAHSLQPAPTDDGYQAPTIPALKRKGFVTWQTIQLLLEPQEHVAFLQNAVHQFDILDPATNQPFPKLLPKESLPDKPDEAMLQWHESVSEKLRRDAEAEADRQTSNGRHEDRRDSARTSGEISRDDRGGAAEFLRDPLYPERDGRPTVVRRFSKNPSHSPRSNHRPYADDRARAGASNSVRHFWSPWTRRRSLPDDQAPRNDFTHEEEITPTSSHPPRYTYKRPQPPRREATQSSTESEEEGQKPTLRHRRSHEPANDSREYFPPQADHGRRYSAEVRRAEPSAGYGPTKAPLFATQVAHAQSAQYYTDRRSSVPRSSHGRQSARYPGKGDSARERDPTPIIREPLDRYEYSSRNSSRRPSRDAEHREKEHEWDRERDRHNERERDRERESERDRPRGREHDPERGRGRDNEREPERERSRSHRYAKADPLDGVGGRRYPVEAPWR